MAPGNRDSTSAGLPSKRRTPYATTLHPTSTVKYKSYHDVHAYGESGKLRPSELLEATSKKLRVPQTLPPVQQTARPRILELLNLADFSHYAESVVPLGDPIFQPYPSTVTFSGYQPFATYETTLKLRNNDRVGRRVKILPPDNPAFTLRRLSNPSATSTGGASAASSLIAPGMEATYILTFSPASREDHACDLIVCTEREKFILPVRAVGATPALDLPDEILFGPTLCRTESSRVFQITNVGTETAAFRLLALAEGVGEDAESQAAAALDRERPAFRVEPSAGTLAPGEALQVTVWMSPGGHRGSVEGQLVVQLPRDVSVAARLAGVGHEVDVGVDRDLVLQQPTYMNKVSQRSFKIINNSDTVTKFSFYKHPRGGEGRAGRPGLATATGFVEEIGPQGQQALGLAASEGESVDSSDEEDAILRHTAVDFARTARRGHREEITCPDLFESEIFHVEPRTGEVWPGGEVDITVRFMPVTGAVYEETAYVELSGRGARLPVTLKGEGLGPKAMFSYDVLDVGDTYVHTVHQYEVELYNRGEVSATFHLEHPDTAVGKMFTFAPSEGTVEPRASQVITARFISDTLGDFDARFTCHVQGSFQPLSLDFRGHVVGPEFDVTETDLDFEEVAYGFSYKREFTVNNTCEIPMRFALRLADESEKDEFVFFPSVCTLEPHTSCPVVVDFHATKVAHMSNKLLLDVVGVGQALRTINLTATTRVPVVEMSVRDLDFGDCFLNHPYKQTIKLVNNEVFPAKFEVLAQDEASRNLGTVMIDPPNGVVPGEGEVELTVITRTVRVGRMGLPARIEILGSSSETPLECVVTAQSIGPVLEFLGEDDARVATTKVAFGSIPCLKEVSATVRVYNPCPVAASFRAFIEAPNSVFMVEPRAAGIPPQSSFELRVSCLLDDMRKFTDTLHVVVDDGDDMEVPLVANGTGSTLLVDGLDAANDMGTLLVGRPFEMVVEVMNAGRRAQSLTWYNPMKEVIAKRLKAEARAKMKAPKASAKGAEDGELPGEEMSLKEMGQGEAVNPMDFLDVPIFSVEPDRATINPRTTTTFIVRGLSHVTGDANESLVLKGSMGATTKDLLTAGISATFIKPLVSLSESSLGYKYAWSDSDPEPSVLTRPLTLTNLSSLPLALSVKTMSPFRVADLQGQYLVQPNMTETLGVEYDPRFTTDSRESLTSSGKLLVNFLECAQKETVELVGEAHYPNVLLSETKVDFGCVLTDTLERRTLTMKNTSTLPAEYNWSLATVADGQATISTEVAPPEAFDILPVHGTLAPGECQEVEVSYFAHPGSSMSCEAICAVRGGPSYTMSLVADNSNIRYSVDKAAINLGRQQYNRTVDTELVLANTGKVAFAYYVNLTHLGRKGLITCHNPTGTLNEGKRVTLRFTINPLVPDKIVEEIRIEVGHLEPEVVKVTVDGVYQSIILGLPRADEETLEVMRHQASQSLALSGPRIPLPDAVAMGSVGAQFLVQQLKALNEAAAEAAATGASATSIGPGRGLGPGAFTMRRQPTSGADAASQMATGTMRRGSQLGASRAGGRLGGQRGNVPVLGEMVIPPGSVFASVYGQEYAASTTEIDLEVDRACLVAHLDAKTEAQAHPSRAPTPSVDQADASSSRVVAAEYVLDFGYVTKGMTKSRKFKLQNTNGTVIMLGMDRKLLKSMGMTLDPERISKLPEYSTTTFTVTLDSTVVKPGHVLLPLALDVKGSPAVMLNIKAHVVVPELHITMDRLDFGRVIVGNQRVINVQLHNPREVTAEWSIRKPTESAKDWDFFTCVPASGIIPPNGRMLLQIHFSPVRDREAPYSQRFPIKVNNNPRAITLYCTGAGFWSTVVASEVKVDLGAILPALEEKELAAQQPNRARFELQNPTEVPIEVYALDTDATYLEEEEMLNHLETFNDKGVLYVAPRVAGDAFWPDLQKQAQTIMAAKAAEEEAARRAAEIEANGGVEPEVVPPGKGKSAKDAKAKDATKNKNKATPSAAEVESADGVGEVEPVPEDTRLFLVTLAGRGVGGSTLSSRLAKRYGLEVVTLESLLAAAADLEIVVPEDYPPEVADSEEEGGSGNGNGDGKKEATGDGDMEVSEEEPTEEVVIITPEDRAARTAAIQEMMRVAEACETVANALNTSTEDGIELKKSLLANEVIDTVLPHVLRSERFANGVVFDGVEVPGPLFVGSAADAMCRFATALGYARREVLDKKNKPTGEMTWEPLGGYPEGGVSPKIQFVVLDAPAEAIIDRQRATAQAAAEARARSQEPLLAQQSSVITDVTMGDVSMEMGDSTPEESDEAAAAREAEIKALTSEWEKWSTKSGVAAMREMIGLPALGPDAEKPASVESMGPFLVRNVDADPRQWDETQVLHAVVGVSWHLGELSTLLPTVAADVDLIPPVYDVEVLKRPRPRTKRGHHDHFTLDTLTFAPPPEGSAEGEDVPMADADAPLPEPDSRESGKARWIIPAFDKVVVEVLFKGKEVGVFHERMGFEARGGNMVDVALSGACAYPQLQHDFRNVFYRKSKARPPSAAISQQFIISEEVFDYGPLLYGRNRKECLEVEDHTDRLTTYKPHMAQFRMTNNGRFPLHVNFHLKSTTGAKGGGSPESPIFLIEPATMDLAVDETQDLTVYAFPSAEGSVSDVVVATVNLNPEPWEIPIQATGTHPLLELEGLADVGDAKNPKKGVAFERLLCGKKHTHTVTFTNTGLVPAMWRLEGFEQLPEEFILSRTSGVIAARASEEVNISLHAGESKLLEAALKLVVTDVGEPAVFPTLQEVPITLTGEAYSIVADVTFPDADKEGVDFGTIRVQESATKVVKVTNNGKYEITYAVQTRPGPTAAWVVVEPSEGAIAPGQSNELLVRFNPARKLAKEVRWVKDLHTTIQIFEPLHADATQESTISLPISVEAVFSKYAVTPLAGLNFGPHVYDTTSAPKTLSIRNTGAFPFDVTLFDYAAGPPEPKEVEPEPEPAPAVDAKGAKGKKTPAKEKKPAGKDKKAAEAAPVGITVGPFTLEPATLVVEPGTTATFKVTFAAKGRETFRSSVGIDVSFRDPTDVPQGIEYEVIGESCFPGINTVDLAGIFEEHRVLPAVDPFQSMAGVFALRERLFDFGPVLAAVTSPDPTDGATANEVGVTASFKIANPVKVPCVVNFAVEPTGNASSETLPLRVEPARLQIPPHENRYVTVTFAPHRIESSSARFIAQVENGGDPETARLSFDLRGEGVLPNLTLVAPRERDAHGRALLKFPRHLLGRAAASAPITLRNDGALLAYARVNVPVHQAFRLASRDMAGSVQLAPGESRTIMVEYLPQEAGPSEETLTVDVRHNVFDTTRVALQGECYQEDVLLVHLPEESPDELRFPDTALVVSEESTDHTGPEMDFALKNISSHKSFRYDFTDLPSGLQMRPSRGVLLPGASTAVVATLSVTEPVAWNGIVAGVSLEELASVPSEWDDRMAPELEPTSVGPRVGVEPRRLPLKVWATVDTPKLEAEWDPISFKPTMMFQTRTFTFPVANAGMVSLEMNFAVHLASGPRDAGPFAVHPEHMVLHAGESAEVTVKYAPREVDPVERALYVQVVGEASPRVRKISGSALRPWCHFELPASDYLSSGRRNPEMPDAYGNTGPLDPATRTLEMESLGYKVRNTQRFYVLNPTSVTYDFVWEPVGTTASGKSAASTAVVCQTRRGTVGGGRRYEMIFSYVPTTDSLLEAHWMFRIPSQNIAVPFLLVGHVQEPRVRLDSSAINFGMVQLNGRVRETVHLINDEAIPFEFSFDKATFDATRDRIQATGIKPVVTFEPAIGSVPAKSKLPVTVSFVPNVEQLYNYNVVCYIKKKPTRLTLNTKGQGFAIHDALSVDASDGQSVLLTDKGANEVDFGQVIVNERAVKMLTLVNSGVVPFEFGFTTGMGHDEVTLTPMAGMVRPGERMLVELAYCPSKPEDVRDFAVTCQVVNGRTYRMKVFAKGHKPKLDLSFYSHAFGPTLLCAPGSDVRPQTVVLRAVNNDTEEVSLDCLYENTDYLYLEGASATLAPGEATDVSITFAPQEAKAYNESIAFQLSGLVSVAVKVSGTGVPMSLGLAEGGRILALGAVRVGQMATKTARLKNGAGVAVDVDLTPASELLAPYGVLLVPGGPAVVPARGVLEVSVQFKPEKRVRPFETEIPVLARGAKVFPFTLSGGGMGVDVRLVSDQLPFGPVVKGAQVTKRLQLSNGGDVGAKFEWDMSKCGPHFSLSPKSGFVAPGSDVKIDVTFAPQDTNPDIRVEGIKLKIDGMDDQFLTLMGACVDQKPEGTAVSFEAATRETQVQKIELKNDSSTDWIIRPVIASDVWTGAEFITVPMGTTVAYEVTFRPLRMATAEDPFHGSVFFPLPTGKGFLHPLVGVAGPPNAAERVTLEGVAREPVQATVKVHNWAKKSQRFTMSIQWDEGVTPPKGSVMDVTHHVDVPGLTSRDVRMTMTLPVETSLKGRLVASVETTGEYVYYPLTVTMATAKNMPTLSLRCPVRQVARASTTVSNPLDEPATLTLTTSGAGATGLTFPATLEVPAKGTATVPVSFRPLVEQPLEASITASHPDLGTFVIPVVIQGLSTAPERGLEFAVPLGCEETRSVTLSHWLPAAADYTTSWGQGGAGGAFSVPAPGVVKATPATAAPQGGFASSEMTVSVVFEPTSSGLVRDTLTLTSATGGVYHLPVVGRCGPPKPRGPIDIIGASGTVQFKNVFAKDTTFKLATDSAAFTVKESEVMKAKQQASIAVQYTPKEGASTTAVLTVTCAESPSPWVFYLRAAAATLKK